MTTDLGALIREHLVRTIAASELTPRARRRRLRARLGERGARPRRASISGWKVQATTASISVYQCVDGPAFPTLSQLTLQLATVPVLRMDDRRPQGEFGLPL
jgi:hypothetical protein